MHRIIWHVNIQHCLFGLYHFYWLSPDLLDGSQDSIGYDSSLISSYGVSASVTDSPDISRRVVVFEGQASDGQYLEASKKFKSQSCVYV